MNIHAVHHLPDVPYAYGSGRDRLKIRLRSARGDLKKVTIYYKDRYDWENDYKKKDMDEIITTSLFSFYGTEITVRRARFRYFFLLEEKSGRRIVYDAGGFREPVTEGFEYRGFQFAYSAQGDTYKPKEIFNDAVVYQIFPERFRNGNKENDPPGTLPWGGIPAQGNFFGGDIKGITQGLPYLKDLGINMIYLTPVFSSSSNHKYNINNYFALDPQFGTMEEVREMVEKAHSMGIRVIFDAVFNHTGSDIPMFLDVMQKGEKSPYSSWYHIDSYPADPENPDYYTFATGIGSMPKLRTENHEVREYFYSAGKFWIEKIGIDGWRLDVSDEVDHKFWQGFKEAVESVNPNAVLIGEIMHEASSFLRGNELDSVMNYPFKDALCEYFARRETDETHFTDTLSNVRALYTDEISSQLWNLIGSHDTPRFLTEARGEVKRLLLALAFQFSYPGVPYIYYGDEAGLDGGRDPYCRRCMEWDEEKQDKRILDFTKKMIEFRKKYPELTSSKVSFRTAPGMIAMERKSGDELSGRKIIIYFNNQDKEAEIKPEDNITEITPTDMEGKTPGELYTCGHLILKPMSFRAFLKEE